MNNVYIRMYIHYPYFISHDYQASNNHYEISK